MLAVKAPRQRQGSPNINMVIGEAVEVFSRFDRTWADGFNLVGTARDSDGEPVFVVRRQSDDLVLPARFALSDVRSDDDARFRERVR